MREIERRRVPLQWDWGAGVLVGVALLALASLPWLAPTPGTHRVTASLVLVLAGAMAAWLARPRRVPPMTASDLSDPANPSLGARAIELTYQPAESRGRAGRSYAAAAHLSSGAQIPVAEGGDPSVVLQVATMWARQLDVPMVPGWGLTAADLAAMTGGKPRPSASEVTQFVGMTHAGAKGAAISLVLSAAALSLLVGTVAASRNAASHPSSWFLWALAVVLLLLIALAAVADRIHVRVGDSVQFERRVCGILVRQIELPVQGVELVRLVSPTGVGGHHLLLAAAGRFWALECEPAAGRTIEGFFSRMRPSKP